MKLTSAILRWAYSHGYFPMPDETGEILWYHPDPRAILPLEEFHCSRSLKRTLRRVPFRYTMDRAFESVIAFCADRPETWIDNQMRDAYIALHGEGDAHSVEVWLDDRLVGGLYGVALRGAFFAESKFHRVTDASKAALLYLVNEMRQRCMTLLDVQFLTPHLKTLGVVEVSREAYLGMLEKALEQDANFP